MSLVTTNQNRVVIKKAESMMLVPYVYDSTTRNYVLGENVYDISAIIGDTITIEQSDGETSTKYNEFVGSPLLNAFHNTKYSFTAQCLDFQNAAIRPLFDVMVPQSRVDGLVAFNDDFVPLYVLIRITFSDLSLPHVYLPKVQLNSKLAIGQLKTRASQANISGIALPQHCVVRQPKSSYATTFVRMDTFRILNPYTPVIFAPSTCDVFVFYRHGKTPNDIFSSINFNSGEVLANTFVDLSSGLITQSQPT